MNKIADYQILELLWKSSKSLIYRCLDTEQNPVIIKVLLKENADSHKIAQFRREYELTSALNSPWIISSYDLIYYNDSLAIVIEDFGGISLKEYLGKNTPVTNEHQLKEAIQVAVLIARSLTAIHDLNIIHKDINSSNIVYNPSTNKLKIIDFGIASELSVEHFESTNQGYVEGTYAYMSPEQTGRINRGLDYRSDYYSYGITLYELFCGILPFQANNSREWIHCHIAKQPVELCDVNSKIPRVLSDIVMKLLHKSAEYRYQSGFGIIKDLETCLNDIDKNGNIKSFRIGEGEVSQRFQLPQKLYGREQETQQLLNSLKAIARGECQLIVVSGYSGIGKSSLVREIQTQITQKKGLFIEGKYDALKRNIPYFGFVQALTQLINTIISESDTQLNIWKEELIGVLKDNAQLIIDILPELELIIGPQKEPEQLEVNEAQNRFLYTFQSFIQTFASLQHPLVIFLDDLQWADSASLDMLQNLLTNNSTSSLLIIGAYRDNEVQKGHLLARTLDALRKEGKLLSIIKLKELQHAHVLQMVNDVFACSKEDATKLAEISLRKTQGNPYFMNEFLSSLYRSEQASFNSTEGKWVFDFVNIYQLDVTENVVYLISKRVAELPELTRELLKIASCIGTRFSLNLLTLISSKNRKDIIEQLKIALKDFFLIPITDNYILAEYELNVNSSYKFPHDKVRQAFYSLLSEKEKKQTNLDIGRLFIKEYDYKTLDDELFTILEHVNGGIDLLEEDEKSNIARLNLKACLRALVSGAFNEAHKYSSIGLSLLSQKHWKIDYDLIFKLYLNTTRTASLCSDYSKMEQLISEGIKFVRSNIDKVKFHEIKVQALIAQNKQKLAIGEALNLLNTLGVKLPTKPGFQHLILKLIKTQFFLKKRSKFEITNYALMKDEQYLIVMRNMAIIISVLYRTDPILFTLVVFEQLIITVRHGIAPISPVSFVTYGLLLNSMFNQVNKGFNYALLGMSLFKKMEVKRHWAQAFYIHNIGVRTWKESLAEINSDLHKCYTAALDSGDFETMMSAAAARSHYLFLAGHELGELLRETENYKYSLQPYHQKIALSQFNVLEQMFSNFQVSVSHPEILNGEFFNEEEMIKYHKKENDETSLFTIYLNKLTLAYYFGRYSQAAEIIKQSRHYLKGVSGLLMYAVFIFLESLSLLAGFGSFAPKEKKKALSRVYSNQKKLKNWTRHSPSTFANKYSLVQAELARVKGGLQTAVALYSESIELAHASNNIYEEALTYEMYARYLLTNNRLESAKLNINKAYKLYDSWGAFAKKELIETEFDNYIITEEYSSNESRSTTVHLTTHTSARNTQTIDLETVLDASKAISSELVLSALVRKSLIILLEHAGAQKGILLIKNFSTNSLMPEALGTVGLDKIEVVPMREQFSNQLMPESVVRYTERTGKKILLHNACREGNFVKDSYIKKNNIKSLLAIPILKLAKVVGVLYLENNLSTEIFTPDRINVLTILCTQTAISLENARIYSTLEQKVKERTLEIENARDQLKELNATKDKFFSIIGHDLRGPMGSISHLLAVLSEEENLLTPEETRHYLRMLSESTRQSYELLENLLTWARTQRNEIKYEPARHNLHHIVDSNILLFRQTASNKNLNLLNEIPKELTLFADRDMIDAIIRNLINNSVKYTREAGIIRIEATNKKEAVHISVQDNGIGMKPEILDGLFNLVSREGNRKGTSGEKGTGLGLILCKEFIEKHNGQMWVESKENEGSKFTFSIPC